MNPAWLDLPVRVAVPELRRALDQCGTAVLAAPPGTGKTTLVPLALAGLVPEADPDAQATTSPVSQDASCGRPICNVTLPGHRDILLVAPPDIHS